MRLLVALYLLAIVAANLLVARFGPAAAYVNAFLFIGLDLASRDRLHDAWQSRRRIVYMALLIATGSVLSYLLNRNAGTVAVASFVAFAAAATADSIVYWLLRRRPYLQRSNGSNVVGAAVDSLVFPTIAFGGFSLQVTVLQFLAKVAGGFVWSWVLRK